MLSLLRLNSSEVWQIDEITVAADWWSVGALLYELITGQVRVIYLFSYYLLKYLKFRVFEECNGQKSLGQ